MALPGSTHDIPEGMSACVETGLVLIVGWVLDPTEYSEAVCVSKDIERMVEAVSSRGDVRMRPGKRDGRYHPLKTLFLVRHAKSSWKEASLPDLLRPLNKRGRRDAPMMGHRLARRGVEVELILSSPATRTQQTAEALAEELFYAWDEIVTEEALYEADAAEILAVIEEQDRWIDSLMVVGHNPGLTSLANYLGRTDFENIPTLGVVELRYDVEAWSDVAGTEPAAVSCDYPKRETRVDV